MSGALWLVLCLAGLATGLWALAPETPARAQAVDTTTSKPLPFLWHRREGEDAPDLAEIKGINFLTDSDYPPFNYRDDRGNLVGFNVDLAKAMCSALRIRCRIAARPWADLIPALEDKTADAVIASIAISEQNRARVDFTVPYYRSPARFVVQKQNKLEEANPEAFAGKPVAVRKGTAHEAFLKAFFSTSDIRTYDTESEMREALRTGEIDAFFADGTASMFWVNGTASRGCCRLAPGAYTESRYFGNGAGIAVARGNVALREALNYALDRIKVSGAYDRIYRKHFPLALY